MPLGQGWLNAWVKVNSKHVVFPGNNRGDKEDKDAALNASTSKRHTAKGKISSSDTVTANTVISEDTETQAIRRFNTRKHKRRLQRTKSASDLLRDKAKEDKELEHDENAAREAEAVLDKSSSSQVTVSRKAISSVADTAKLPPRIPQHEEPDVASIETEGSLRFVAGFFGTDIGALPSAQNSWHQHDTNRFPRDAASAHVGHHNDLDMDSLPSRGGVSLPAKPYHSNLKRTDSNDSASKGSGFRFPPNIFSGDNSNGKSQCRHCTKVESELLACKEDLEYLRSLAIRSEYICTSCEVEPSKRLDRALRIASETGDARMLDEITLRHNAEIEIRTKDTQRWQRDTIVKLEKYASLCKDLNEEAALRSREAVELHRELDIVRFERDELATELQTAKATIAQYERREKERNKAEILIRDYELKGLDGAERAIKTRDSIITDLSGRLERTLDLLEAEREQQRQRRQIFFPSPRPSHGDNDGGIDFEVELKNTKDSLREQQFAMEALQRETERKELEWKLKLENLERQLEAARSQ